MNSEFIAMLDYLEREKGIKREVLVEAVQNALLSASKKAVETGRDLRIEIDPKSGEIRAIAKLIVAEKVTNKHDEISLANARKIKADVQPGEELDVEVTPSNFGRIAAQTAKQAMMQRIRQAEKEMIYDEFKDRAGEIVSGTVRRFERSDVVVDLGKFEATMPSRERVQTEDYNIGDRIRAYVVAVENGARGPEIIISRSHPNFVRRLFEMEVSEIADRTVEIRGIAREAGYRTKIAGLQRKRQGGPRRCLRRHARFARQEYRPRAEQREGRYHPLERRREGICPRSAQASQGEERHARGSAQGHPDQGG
jgi:N utilization substance protein A